MVLFAIKKIKLSFLTYSKFENVLIKKIFVLKFRKENKYSIIKYINKKKLKNQMFSTTKTLSGFNVYVVYIL